MAPAPTGTAPAQTVLSELPVGTRVQDTFIVLDAEARGGDTPHTLLTFGNATGRLASSPFWPSERGKIAGVVKGSVVEVRGVVSTYRDRRQLTVETLRVLRGMEIDWHQLLPSVGSVSDLWAQVDRWRAGLNRSRLARTVGLFYDDAGFRERYQRCPASIAGHHARLGGLLHHTVEVAGIAGEIARHYEGSVNHDLVLAGVLLHDIGKLESYGWEGIFEMTVPGSVIGHVVLGALMLERRVRASSPMPCTEDELIILQHIVLSHHGKLEFGAPVPPMTLEAEIVHYADNASAKAASMTDALNDGENFPGGVAVSARGIWQLDRRRAWRADSDWGASVPG
jgi:3'-5' exoribonuclease